MAGLLGASPEAPVTFEAGYANPNNSASNSEIGISLGGSELKGAFLMTTPVMHPHTCKKVSAAVHPSAIDVQEQAWPQDIPMTSHQLVITVDGQTVRIPAQGKGNMFHRWLAWLMPELRPNAYKLMNAGYDCYGVYLYVTGKGGKPALRKGVVRHGK